MALGSLATTVAYPIFRLVVTASPSLWADQESALHWLWVKSDPKPIWSCLPDGSLLPLHQTAFLYGGKLGSNELFPSVKRTSVLSWISTIVDKITDSCFKTLLILSLEVVVCKHIQTNTPVSIYFDLWLMA